MCVVLDVEDTCIIHVCPWWEGGWCGMVSGWGGVAVLDPVLGPADHSVARDTCHPRQQSRSQVKVHLYIIRCCVRCSCIVGIICAFKQPNS